MWYRLKKKTRQRIIRTFTFVFLVLFVLSVAAALLITGLKAPTQ